MKRGEAFLVSWPFSLSYAVCNTFLTMDQAKAHRRMGTSSAAAMARIEDCLKTVLQLP
jgi:mRNA-degrading endonuclease toxin of MazEF toxin-antitoxin module